MCLTGQFRSEIRYKFEKALKLRFRYTVVWAYLFCKNCSHDRAGICLSKIGTAVKFSAFLRMELYAAGCQFFTPTDPGPICHSTVPFLAASSASTLKGKQWMNDE